MIPRTIAHHLATIAVIGGHRLAMTCLFLAFFSIRTAGQPIWVEDFNHPIRGFNHEWTVSAPSGSPDDLDLSSNGETARLKIGTTPNAYASILTKNWIDWDTRSNRWVQISVPNLEFGERIKVLAHSSKEGGSWRILHDEWAEIPGQGAQPQTLDLNAAIPPGSQQVLLMIELVDNIWGDPPAGAQVHIDWIKAGMPPTAAAPSQPPQPEKPIEGETVGNYPSLAWRPPTGFEKNLYSLTLSLDPLFSDSSTITLRDQVVGTNLTLTTRLQPGRWYWKVSATGTGGLSGPFSTLSPDPAFDPRDPRSRRHSSFVVQDEPQHSRHSGPMAIRMGSQGFGAPYRFSSDPVLVEQAKACLKLGSQSYKFMLGWDHYRTVYSDLPELPPSKRATLTQLVENEKAYSDIFAMPFRFYCMWTYAMGIPYWHFRDGLSEAHAQAEYNQLYDLTRHLISKYQNAGKTFLLGHWEGDWVLLEGYDPLQTPREQMIAGMISWYQIRQKAVEDARNSLPDSKGVWVYHYAEVNLVEKALQGRATVASRVLPHVAVDAVSYSAYDATSFRLEMPSRLNRHLDYLWWNSRFTGSWPHGRPVFVGEFGLGGSDRAESTRANYEAARAAHVWGCPLIQFWSVYQSSKESTSALIDASARTTDDYHMLRRFIVGSSHLRGATRAWLGREPLEAELNAFGALPEMHLGTRALQFVLNSPRFASSMGNREFVRTAFSRTTRSFDPENPLAVQLMGALDSGAISRWSCLLSILDSSSFRSAVSDKEFSRYLNGISSGEWGSEYPIPPEPRSQLYLRALDSEAFGETSVRDGAFGTLLATDSLRWAADLAQCPVHLAAGMDQAALLLSIKGHTGAKYRIEESADLMRWNRVGQVDALDGSAQFRVDAHTAIHQFFRAVAE